MTFSYFPGCTLKTRGKQLDIYGRRAFEALGVELQELPEWQCCGAVYPMAKDEIATRLSAVRALMSAPDASTAWNLRCLVRERFIAFLQANYPQCLPQTRLSESRQAYSAPR